MKDIMEKHTIINLKRNGNSNRAVERKTGINRKTVAKYWNEYVEQSKLLNDGLTDNISEIQEAIVAAPKYDSSTRGSRKYTDQMDKMLDQILSQEERKDRLLGAHKQKLTKLQIHQFLVEDGYDISYSTIAVKISEKLNKNKECFIRQLYDLGDRLEYDFGEIKLLINGVLSKYYMAVVSSPAANFRWAFLYKKPKERSFYGFSC